MKKLLTDSTILFALLSFIFPLHAFAEKANPGIEIYVDGKSYKSLKDYERAPRNPRISIPPLNKQSSKDSLNLENDPSSQDLIKLLTGSPHTPGQLDLNKLLQANQDPKSQSIPIDPKVLGKVQEMLRSFLNQQSETTNLLKTNSPSEFSPTNKLSFPILGNVGSQPLENLDSPYPQPMQNENSGTETPAQNTEYLKTMRNLKSILKNRVP